MMYRCILVILFAVVPGSVIAAAIANTPRQANGTATIISTKVICKEQGKYLGSASEYSVNEHGHPITTRRVMESMRYVGWPTAVKTRDGQLLVVFSGDRDAHICPWGKTEMIKSCDNGKTWSEPVTVMNTPLDDRDAGILETKNGTLLFSWCTSMLFSEKPWSERYARHAEKITPDIREKWLGSWVCRSTDQGKTWKEPVRIAGLSPHGPIQLRDGRLLYVGYDIVSIDRKNVMVEQSTDDGCSWTLLSSIPIPDEILTGSLTIAEPHVVELGNGKLVALIRHEHRDDHTRNFLLQSESYDGGKTWSAAYQTRIVGYPPHIIQLGNGWLLVAYARRTFPFRQLACISRDEGATWDVQNEIILNDAPNGDMGYPSSVQLEDGTLLTIFYQREKSDEKPSLMCTHWRLH